MKCDTCVILKEADSSPEPAACIWYMDNVVLGNKTVDNCPLYKEEKDA